MQVRPAITPEDVQSKSGAELRSSLVIEGLFLSNRVTFVLSHHDRILIGGAHVEGKDLELAPPASLRTDFLCQRRELGIVCIDNSGSVAVDGTDYPMSREDILYVGMGSKQIFLKGRDATFYFTSSAAHSSHPTTLITKAQADSTELGTLENSNERTLRKYIHDQGVSSCSMAMGITTIKPGSVWNTMPCHTHERRTEAYLYFDLDSSEKVIHLFGKPDQTRNFVLSDREVVISPAWSIHTGAGTKNYRFVWSTAGENITYSDLDPVATSNLR